MPAVLFVLMQFHNHSIHTFPFFHFRNFQPAQTFNQNISSADSQLVHLAASALNEQTKMGKLSEVCFTIHFVLLIRQRFFL